MDLSYFFCGARYESKPFERFKGSTAIPTDVELRKVFNGITFVTEEGERLSVCMRDSGFEIHYYTNEDNEGKGFDLGWFMLNAGSVDLPNWLVNAAVKRTPEQNDRAIKHRSDVWIRASLIVDKIIEDKPLEDYRIGSLFGNTGTTMTVAEQKVALIRDVADWLLEEGE